MGKTKRIRQIVLQKKSQLKNRISTNDARLKAKDRVAPPSKSAKLQNAVAPKVVEKPKESSAIFFGYNTQLGPPYHIILDTNFINFAIKNKLDICKHMMECLYAKCTPYITDCVMGELESFGSKAKLALQIVRDPRFERIPCLHKGIYADDCIVDRVTQHKCYIVGTNDKELKRRIRKIPGVPIMAVTRSRFAIERMPDAFNC